MKALLNYYCIIFSIFFLITACGKEERNDNNWIVAPQGEMPVLTTDSVRSIKDTIATGGGKILNLSTSSRITERGLCWRKGQMPTIADNRTIDTSSTETFVHSMYPLEPNTTYWVRAYATNYIGTGYGGITTFRTLALNQVTPEVSTNAVSNITQNSATCGGKVISAGSAPVTARGVCWNTSPNPNTSQNKTVNGSGTGSFTSLLTGLSSNTTYYVRAYATNSIGTAYGNTVTFTTH